MSDEEDYFTVLLVGAEPWAIEQVREDYERLQDAGRRAQAEVARLRDIEADHDRSWRHLPDATGSLDEAVGSVVGALEARLYDARAEVTRLRSLLAEPSEDEVRRLVNVFCLPVYGIEDGRHSDGIRALLADLRERAGGGE